MGRHIRIQYTDELLHVTNRFLEARFFAAPNPNSTIHADFEAILAEAIITYGLILYAGVLMSNHYHLCLRAPLGNISLAMRYIQTELAKAINRDRGRTGTVFPTRFEHTVIGGDRDAQVDILRYIILNPAAANLVQNPHHWPGFITRSSWRRAPNETLPVTHLPCFDSLKSQRDALMPIIAEQIAAVRRRRRGVLGVKAICRTHWDGRSRAPKKSAPRKFEDTFKSHDPVEKQRLIDLSRAVEAAYRDAAQIWVDALDVRARGDGFLGLVWVLGRYLAPG